jgi:hypothetical protein
LRNALVRQALRSELERLGYEVAGDTVGLRDELYVKGAGDLAAALFEVKTTAGDACNDMYQGRWFSQMPPRFAVLPPAERSDPGLDMLLQSGLSVLFYDETEGNISFPELADAVKLFKNLGQASPDGFLDLDDPEDD